MKIENEVTHIDNIQDHDYLKKELFWVNMRLFNSSISYKNLVLSACERIELLCSTTMDGYKKPHGMSGANAGIPWNIICYVKNRGKENESYETMINPHIIDDNGEVIETISNCGSIRLKEPIKVIRQSRVHVVWHNVKGIECNGWFSRNNGGFTIQHEIDHNLGILITDRAV